jgi:S1-C subfamily serine protease
MGSHCLIRGVLFSILTTFCFQAVGNPYFVPLSHAEEPGALTLSAAVDKALKNNPLIRITLSGREIADAQLREARAGWFPLLQFSESFTRGNNPVFVFGSLLEQARFGTQNFQISALNNPEPLSNFRTAISLRQALFDQLQTYTRVAQASLGQQQADLQKAMVEQQVRFEVIRAYYGTLVAHAKKEVAEEAVKMAESDVKRTQDRFQNGLVVQSDPLAAEVQLGEFRQQQIDAEGDVVIAYEGKEITDAGAFQNEVANTPIGHEAKVTVLRNGLRQEITVKTENLEASTRTLAASVKDRLGAEIRPVTPKESEKYGLQPNAGVAVAQVDPKGPLGKAGFEVGDLILGINNQPIDSLQTFVTLVDSLKPNQRVTLVALDHNTGNTGNVMAVVR